MAAKTSSFILAISCANSFVCLLDESKSSGVLYFKKGALYPAASDRGTGGDCSSICHIWKGTVRLEGVEELRL